MATPSLFQGYPGPIIDLTKPEIVAAIIGFIGLILAALITTYGVRKGKKRISNERTANVRPAETSKEIHASLTPDPTSKLDVTLCEIGLCVNDILIENEKVFSPLLHSKLNKEKFERVSDLYNIQKSRLSFGIWSSVLTNYKNSESNSEKFISFSRLINLLSSLHEILYGMETHGLQKAEIKYYIYRSLRENSNSTLKPEDKDLITTYLKNLQNIVEDIGIQIGKLRGHFTNVT